MAADVRLCATCACRRWALEHSDVAAQVRDAWERKQQADAQVASLQQQLQVAAATAAAQQSSISELSGEVGSVRELVMLLGKALGKQPRGQQLPGHEDPVWLRMGPLGGVQHALGVVIAHVRAQVRRTPPRPAEQQRRIGWCAAVQHILLLAHSPTNRTPSSRRWRQRSASTRTACAPSRPRRRSCRCALLLAGVRLWHS